MKQGFPRLDVGEWPGRSVAPGERADLEIVVSQSYSGAELHVPVHVARAEKPGPTLFVTGALHGDEINGTGVVRELALADHLDLKAGALVLVPVVNLLAFERHSRYLPDRRDLNRAFPGNPEGSMARRLAAQIFREIVGRCDYGIDLHSAAVRRTNLPNVRGDLSDPAVRRIALAFGSHVVVDNKGPDGSLRREACRVGCPTILLEAGEVWKVEPTVVETALRGVRNVLLELDMIEGEQVVPAYQVTARRTRWVRAEVGGFLRFHVSPGDVVMRGQVIATNTSLLGREQNQLQSPDSGIVMGMTTLPSVAPGDAIVHIAIPEAPIEDVVRAVQGMSESSLHERVRADLSTSVLVDDPVEDSAG